MAIGWKSYQERAAKFFQSLGLQAQTNATVKGVRTKHAVDVLVRSQHVGFTVTWIVECKLWRSRVSKMHVLGLRQIVSDVGADRGILLAEAGVQSGAMEAAALTNVHITSLAEVRRTASTEISAMRLRELYDRMEKCREAYWEIPKDKRIAAGLRPEVGLLGYTGAGMIEGLDDVLKRAFRGMYPFEMDFMSHARARKLPVQYQSVADVVAAVEPALVELEKLLAAVPNLSCHASRVARASRTDDSVKRIRLPRAGHDFAPNSSVH